MRIRFFISTLGRPLIPLGIVTLLFAGLALLWNEPLAGFITTGIVSLGLGLLGRYFGNVAIEPTRVEGITSVLLLWLIIPLIGAIPFMFDAQFGFINAFFESMSAFTTTGATVLRDFEKLPRSLFMWRAMAQWMGGIGIIVLFIAVFPQLAIAGRQLFFTEAPGPTEERLTPRLKNTAYAVLIVYTLLTVLCFLGYLIFGMPAYEAIAHAFTTLAAGGLSPQGRSFEGYSVALSWVCSLFMILAGVSFSLQYRVLMGDVKALWKNVELRVYLWIIAIASAILFVILLGQYNVIDAARHAVFQVASIVTSTGFASADFEQWPSQADAVLLVLMFIGGSAGSAAGGVKVVRWVILYQNTRREMQRALHPRAVALVNLGDQVVPEAIVRSVAAFITLYLGLFAMITVSLVWLDTDFVSAFTASIAAVGNIGPGLSAVGPMDNYAGLHPISRILLIFGMYAGRLEVVTVFLLFSREFWRTSRRLTW